MRVRHPAAGDSDGVPPTQVDVAGAKRPVDDDGVVTAPPDVARRLAAAWADRFDVDADDLLSDETTTDAACQRCGQSHDDGACWDLIDDGVCPWCDEYEGENVGMHAARAHPDDWDRYSED